MAEVRICRKIAESWKLAFVPFMSFFPSTRILPFANPRRKEQETYIVVIFLNFYGIISTLVSLKPTLFTFTLKERINVDSLKSLRHFCS